MFLLQPSYFDDNLPTVTVSKKITAIKNAKPSANAYKLSDEKGLYLLIQPSGAKWWRIDYRFDGKRKTLSVGVYPEVSLKQARIQRDVLRESVANGTDPAEVRKARKQALVAVQAEQAQAEQIAALIAAGEALPGSFHAIALEWFAKQEKDWVKGHASKIIARLIENGCISNSPST